ncbi:type IV pilin protein [Cupriavidus pauculus]|uniref:type IV pilin protein n=1 Tax=Cupriavidus pauculus TaxID=82633 RepID=UPI001D0C9B2B|nr:prepilin-type N-terminal cleavage/methylation domain-containing protein [Cupriavidus pauculus]
MSKERLHLRAGHFAFSLPELVAALAIVAIVMTLALPTWQRHIERGWRMQARAEMIAAMLTLERHALLTASYASEPGGASPAGDWPKPLPPPPAPTRHWLTATSCAGRSLSHCVEVRATPVRPDAACGTLVLRSSGEWLSMPTELGEPLPLPPNC